MSVVAAVDCGTNSIRLLVLRRDGDQLVELERQVRLARLGQGVDATGEFHPDALARAFAVCEEYAALMAGFGVERLRFVATSAARDVTNRQVFFDGVRQRLGVVPDVISGEEEARLSSAGVMPSAHRLLRANFLLIRITPVAMKFSGSRAVKISPLLNVDRANAPHRAA